jgi:hypothetical protein
MRPEVSPWKGNPPVAISPTDRVKSDEMSDYSLETGEYLWRLTCDCCGKQKNRTWGFISKNGDAHAIYCALLNVEEERPRVGLTLSVGPWWDGSEPSQRSWVHLDIWPGNDGTHMGIRDPKESNYYPWEEGGTPLTREQATLSDTIQEIWPVADFIVATDAAVSSYLKGSGVDAVGREIQQADYPARNC